MLVPISVEYGFGFRILHVNLLLFVVVVVPVPLGKRSNHWLKACLFILASTIEVADERFHLLGTLSWN